MERGSRLGGARRLDEGGRRAAAEIRVVGLSHSRARQAARESQRWEREHPRRPAAKTAAAYHGTWRAALLAAGLPGGRPPLELARTSPRVCLPAFPLQAGTLVGQAA